MPTLSVRRSSVELVESIRKCLERHRQLSYYQLIKLLPDVAPIHLYDALIDLASNGEIYYSDKTTLYSVDPIKEDNYLSVTKPIEVKRPKANLPMPEITIRLSPGIYKALTEYAYEQQTCVEAEAQHLLSEIVRTYQANNVIPTQA